MVAEYNLTSMDRYDELTLKEIWFKKEVDFAIGICYISNDMLLKSDVHFMSACWSNLSHYHFISLTSLFISKFSLMVCIN